MAKHFVNILNQALFIFILALAFITPLFFLPISSEFFQFPKAMLILFASLLLLVLWSLKMILEGKVEVRRTPLDLPLIIFLAVYLLSTIFSIDRFVSLAGPYPQVWGSFANVFSLVILYFVIVSNIQTKEQIVAVLESFLASLFLVSLWAIFSYFNISFTPQNWGPKESFTPLGTFNILATLAIVALPVALYFLLAAKNLLFKLAFFATSLVLFFPLSAVNQFWVWIILGALFALFLFFLPKLNLGKVEKMQLAFLFGLFLVLALLINISPLYQNTIARIKPSSAGQFLPKEQELPHRAGWNIAVGALSQKPFLGTGPGTFPFAFTNFKPLWLNYTNLWNLRFDKSSNEIFRIATEVGILGLLAFFFVIAAFIKLIAFVLREKEKTADYLFLSLLSFSLTAFLLSWFFLVPSLTLNFALFLFLGLFCILAEMAGYKNIFKIKLFFVASPIGFIKALPPQQDEREHLKTTPEPLAILIFIPSFALLLASSFLIYRAFQAEFYFSQSLTSLSQNKTDKAFENLIRAIVANPYRDIYRRSLAQLHLTLAQNLSQKKDLTDQDKQNLVTLVDQAINQAKIASGYLIRPQPGTSSFNVLNWEVLGNIYFSLIGSIQNAPNHAVATFAQATQLDPANVRIWEALAQVYQKSGNIEEAIKNYELGLRAKADYPPAHYNIAQLLKNKEGQEQRVAAELEMTLRFLPQDSPDRSRVEKELEEAKKKLSEKSQRPATLPQAATPSAATPAAQPSR